MSSILRQLGARVATRDASWEATERIVHAEMRDGRLPRAYQLLAELRYAAQEKGFAHLLITMNDGHKVPLTEAVQTCSPMDEQLLYRLTLHVVRYYALLQNNQLAGPQARPHRHNRQRWPLRDWLTAAAIRLTQLVSNLRR